MEKVYLGDSVYVEVAHRTLRLTVETLVEPGHICVSTIYLQPRVVEKLIAYYEQFKAVAEVIELC